MVYYIHTYKEGTALSKESKIAKKEAKAAKKAAKAEKKQASQYAKLVKNIDKKNAKAEKKANKKGKPFTPAPIPTQEEAFAGVQQSKGKKIFKLIILILLIWLVIYFLVMWFSYVAPIKDAEENPEDSTSTAQEYERYVNEHKITTTKNYSVSEAKALLKQVLHDNWRTLSYSSDPSSAAINYTSNIVTVNNADCYEFKASGKTYAVAINLSAVYVVENGEYTPVTFHGTSLITK